MKLRSLVLPFVICALIVVAEVSALFFPKPPSGSAGVALTILAAVTVLCAIFVYVYWFFCVHRLHKVMAELTGGKYPISPRQSVLYQFIPFYNIYWMFRWPMELCDYLNGAGASKKYARALPGCVMLLGGLLGNISTAMVFIDFLILNHLYQGVRELQAQPDKKPESYEPLPFKGPSKVWLWILIIPILGLLAAIAVPNFVKARNKARAAAQAQSAAQPSVGAVPADASK